ncbi:unnamed protein product [Urochloa humidicola]
MCDVSGRAAMFHAGAGGAGDAGVGGGGVAALPRQSHDSSSHGRHQQKQKEKAGPTPNRRAAATALQKKQGDKAAPGHAASGDQLARLPVADRGQFVPDEAILCSMERIVVHEDCSAQDPMWIELQASSTSDPPSLLASGLRLEKGQSQLVTNGSLEMRVGEVTAFESQVDVTLEDEAGAAGVAADAPSAPPAFGAESGASEMLTVSATTDPPAGASTDAISLVFPCLSPPVAQQNGATAQDSAASQHDDDEDEAARKLDLFTAEVQTKVRTPLATLAPRRVPRADSEVQAMEVEFKLPQRSRRIAAQALSNVPASKRGEVLMMKRFGVIDENAIVTKESRKAYDELYCKKLTPKEFTAARVLFPSERVPSSRRTRRSVMEAA